MIGGRSKVGATNKLQHGWVEAVAVGVAVGATSMEAFGFDIAQRSCAVV